MYVFGVRYQKLRVRCYEEKNVQKCGKEFLRLLEHENLMNDAMEWRDKADDESAAT